MTFDSYFKALKRQFRGGLWLTAAMAAGVATSAVALLGVSGWFLVASAAAGAAGPVAAQAFNYLLPSALIRFLAIARTALRYGERLLGHSSALRAMALLRPALFGRLVAARDLSLSRGEASGRFIQDVTALENGLVLDSAPLAAGAGMVTAVGLAAMGSWVSALVLLVFLVLAVVGGVWLHHRFPAAGEDHEVKSRMQKTLSQLADIRTNDPRSGLADALERAEDRLEAARASTVSSDALAQAWVLAVMGLGLTAMALTGGVAAGLALALLTGAMGFESAGAWVRAFGQRARIGEARARIAAVYDREATETAEHGFLDDEHRLNTSRRVRLDGPSGCGKTQMISSLDFDSGRFALAPQDAGILTGTIRHNLLMAGAGIGDAALWAALGDAGLEPRVRDLPKGLDSWIGDGGIALSGGERKRLGLARAYLKPAEVLVLDEPTEGLDAATEAFVVERLAERLARTGQGLILVSHREAPRRLAGEVIQVQ